MILYLEIFAIIGILKGMIKSFVYFVTILWGRVFNLPSHIIRAVNGSI